mmetsp:Transcript_669/g.1873  ORF Transcript_669/g.1873 Transcript_669/m.1873 type:complete len:245 (-) Transcript_669:73-807(-)
MAVQFLHCDEASRLRSTLLYVWQYTMLQLRFVGNVDGMSQMKKEELERGGIVPITTRSSVDAIPLLRFTFHEIQRPQDVALVGLHDMAVLNHLVHQEVHLLQLVHDVQFADGAGPLVHRLDEVVDELQHAQFVLRILRLMDAGLRAHDEEEAGVPAVDHLVASVLQEGALQFGSAQALADDLAFQCGALGHADPFVVRREARLALFVDHQEEGYRHRGISWCNRRVCRVGAAIVVVVVALSRVE